MTSPQALPRVLGLFHAVVVGLGAMLGAGVFVAFGPATAAAGTGVLWALLLAGLIAWANADSSARLAAVMPTSGGAYVYGRRRLSPLWGGVAGWAFVVGKSASAAAIALTAGRYLWPELARPVAVLCVVALTTVACLGARRSARATAVLVLVVLVTLLITVLALRAAPTAPVATPTTTTLAGVLEGAGLLFFAFAGYARIVTLGEEVRTPERTIPRAVGLALVIVLVVYGAVGWSLLHALGPAALAEAVAPVADAVRAVGLGGWAPVVAVVAGLAALGSLLGVLLGISRTGLAMARDGLLPRRLAVIDGRGTPLAAQLTAGVVVALVAALGTLTTAIAVSSAAVLVYYAIAHAAAWTLPGRARRVVPALGLVGCLLVAVSVL